MASTKSRPLSPHLTVWRWGPHMAVSILHRMTGVALTIGGLAVLTWWLLALSGGEESYATFLQAATHPVGLIVLIGLTWAFFQKLLGGLRHLVLDTGAGFELNTNKRFSVLVLIAPVLLTAALWALLLGVRA
jgi:succinate dehydrogenase / fumarate reductase cytochrome b subunit